jgi:hypothetical protein
MTEPPLDPADATAEIVATLAFVLADLLRALVASGRLDQEETRQFLIAARSRPSAGRADAAVRALLNGAWQAMAPDQPPLP